jgi:pimeloyl-ACP methyl ester carboxylesterase
MIASIVVVLFLAVLVVVMSLVLFTAFIGRRVEKTLPPQGRFVDVDGARIHYVEMGQGPTIVMIHGLSGQTRHFTYALADRLSQDFRIVLIDRPGSGYSQRARGASARLRAQGATIAKAIRALKLDKPLLVGHSMGGGVSLAIALDDPDIVGGLALIAPLTHPVDKAPEPFEPLVIESDLRRRLIAWTLATPLGIKNGPKILAHVFAPDPVPADFPVKAGGLLNLRPSAFRSASQDLVAANDDLYDMVKLYPSLTMPVSILYGTEDNILDPQLHGVGMKEKLPSVDLQWIGGGHMPPLIAPDKTAEFIRRAAQRVFAAPAQAAQ